MINTKNFKLVPKPRFPKRLLEVSYLNKLYKVEVARGTYPIRELLDDFIKNNKLTGKTPDDFETKHSNLYLEHDNDAMELFNHYPDSIKPELEICDEKLNVQSLATRLNTTKFTVPVDLSALLSNLNTQVELKNADIPLVDLIKQNIFTLTEHKDLTIEPIERKTVVLPLALKDSESKRVIPIIPQTEEPTLACKVFLFDRLRRIARTRHGLASRFQFGILEWPGFYQLLVFRRNEVGATESVTSFGELPAVKEDNRIELIKQLKVLLRTNDADLMRAVVVLEEKTEMPSHEKVFRQQLSRYLLYEKMSLKEIKEMRAMGDQPRI